MAVKGSCLCGAVRYTVDGPLRNVHACHCTQCRKASGNYVAATSADLKDIAIEGEANVTWYRSSPTARRGFCGTCGSQLFWQADDASTISLGAGALDNPTGVKIEYHIYCADKGDFYEIADGLPQHKAWAEDTTG